MHVYVCICIWEPERSAPLFMMYSKRSHITISTDCQNNSKIVACSNIPEMPGVSRWQSVFINKKVTACLRNTSSTDLLFD